MMITFVSPPCSSPPTPHTHPPQTASLCFHLSFTCTRLSHSPPLLSFPSHSPFPCDAFFPHSLPLCSLSSHCELSRNSSSVRDIHPNGWLCQNKQTTFSPNKKKPQLEQQHLSDIFWASGCANNKIGVVVCLEHFTTLPPFCVVVVHAKIPTGCSCPVGRQETEYLPVKCSCRLTKSKLCCVLCSSSDRSAESINHASGLLSAEQTLEYSSKLLFSIEC